MKAGGVDIEYLILEKQVKELDDKIKRVAAEAFSDRIVPNWLPPEYGKEFVSIKIPIDYMTQEGLKKFHADMNRLIGDRFILRQKQAKKKLDLDITKITEVVPS